MTKALKFILKGCFLWMTPSVYLSFKWLLKIRLIYLFLNHWFNRHVWSHWIVPWSKYFIWILNAQKWKSSYPSMPLTASLYINEVENEEKITHWHQCKYLYVFNYIKIRKKWVYVNKNSSTLSFNYIFY